MCGIAGIISSKAIAFEEDPLQQLQSVLQHRGPDSKGHFVKDNLALFHWRLAVIDISEAGHQPMYSHCDRYVIIYNGEIYNAPEIRKELEDESHKNWRGHSDTEVILEGFAHWREALFKKLNGMFALAIYDKTERRLWLARDRFGIKPLYIWRGSAGIAFCSEPKFLFHLEDFDLQISKKGMNAFLIYGHGIGDWRMMDGLMQLDPGAFARFDLDEKDFEKDFVKSKLSRFVAKPSWKKKDWTEESAAKELRRLVWKSVERQLVSDVPIGVFLSGGIDSSVLTAVASRILGPKETKAFTLGYLGGGNDFDEIAAAQETAKFLGVEHHVLQAEKENIFQNFVKMVWQYDEPFGDAAAMNVLMLSRLIRKHVTVALAGEGSDELFGGYLRHKIERAMRKYEPLFLLMRPLARLLFRLNVRRRTGVLMRALQESSASDRHSAYFEGSPIHPETFLKKQWQIANPRTHLTELYPGQNGDDPMAAMCLADQQFNLVDSYLEKSDKGSMAHSLEIRVPFLDNELADFCNSLPDDLRIRGTKGKWILRQAFRDMLPKSLFKRLKRGFGAPVVSWLREDLRSYFEEMVLSKDARIAAFLDVSLIQKCFNQHIINSNDHSVILWRILVLETWLRNVESGFHAPFCENRKAANDI